MRAAKGWPAALLAALAVCHASPGAAQSIPPRTILDGSGQIGKGKSRAEINAKPTRTQEPLTLGDWLFFPVLDAGYVYNDNVNTSATNKIASSGFRLQPSFVARRNTGIHDTTVYATADLQFYDQSDANQFTGRAGITHVWEIQRDLVARFQGEYGRFVSQSAFSNAGNTFKPIYYDQGYLSSSLTKSFDRVFITGGGSVTNVNYTSRAYPDGNTYTIMSRLGYKISPVFFTYLEPTYNWVRNAQSLSDSQGYSVVAGLGSDRIGLFTFNVYAGYNAQNYSDSRYKPFSGPTFGGSVTWEALRTLNITASASHSLGTAGGQVIGPNYSAIVSRTTGTLAANYAITRQLSATLSGTYDRESYEGLNRLDNIYSSNIGLNYMFTRYIGLNASYAFTKVNSNAPGASYSQNLFTLGGRTQF